MRNAFPNFTLLCLFSRQFKYPLPPGSTCPEHLLLVKERAYVKGDACG